MNILRYLTMIGFVLLGLYAMGAGFIAGPRPLAAYALLIGGSAEVVLAFGGIRSVARGKPFRREAWRCLITAGVTFAAFNVGYILNS